MAAYVSVRYPVSTPLAQDRTENRNFELFWSFKSKKRPLKLFFRFCSMQRMKLFISGTSHFKWAISKWDISMKLHYFEGCPGAFFILSIKISSYLFSIYKDSLYSLTKCLSFNSSQQPESPAVFWNRGKQHPVESEMVAHWTQENPGLLGFWWPTN